MAANEVWRVGRKLERTLYVNDQYVGVMDSADVAARIVETMNHDQQVFEGYGTWCEACNDFH